MKDRSTSTIREREVVGREIFEAPDLDAVHFRARKIAELLRVRATILSSFRDTLSADGFLEVQTPTLTSLTGACEDLSTLFDLSYFQNRAFLRQTSQLYLESFIYSEDTPKVFSFGSSFRAEPKVDSRRLTEFSLLEVEFAGADIDSIIDLASRCISHALARIVSECEEELQKLESDVSRYEKGISFSRISYAEAIDFLQAQGAKNSNGITVEVGDDLNHQLEAILTAHFGPVFVTHYPKAIKFFNMKENRDDASLVNCVDLLLPFAGETIGASEREESWQKLYDNLHAPGMEAAFEKVGGNCLDFKWYLDLRRPYSLSHGGFGIGFERFLQYVVGSSSVQSVTPYPRDAESLSP